MARSGWEAVAPIHSQARVNDSRSHGVLGDRLLSLREAILLTNRDLDENSLSQEELAQLAGFGGDIAWADIDASVVSTLTMERDLPVIVDTNHGFKISGSGGVVTIELGDTRGIVADSDFVDFANLRLRGGEYGIQLTQRDTLFGTLVENVEFVGQGVGGMRVAFRGNGGNGRLQLSGCTFRDLARGLVLDDSDPGRSNQIELLSDTQFLGCAHGVDAVFGPGGFATIYGERLAMLQVGSGLAIDRVGSGPGRQLTVELRHVRVDAGSGTALRFAGDAMARSIALIEASEFSAPGGLAMDLGGPGQRLELEFRDGRLEGAASFGFDSTGSVTLSNDHVRSGSSLAFHGDLGGPARIESCVLEGTRVVGGLGAAPLTIEETRLVGGSVVGAAPPGTGSVDLRACHRAGTSLGIGTTESNPRATAHLGTFEATPLQPRPGQVLNLTVDLPAGLSGVVLFAPWVEFPRVLPDGSKLYGDPRVLLQLGTPLRNGQSLRIPLPNDPALSGLDLFFHLAVLPDPGVNAPMRSLPPGRRVKID